jgi:hypothetical protein
MPEQAGQHHGLADVGVLRGGEQREGAVSGQVAQMLKGFGALGLFEFGPVAAAELLKALRGVAIPSAQFRRRRDRLAPLVEAGFLLAQSPGPDPVDLWGARSLRAL